MELGFINYFKPIFNMEGRGKAFRFIESLMGEVYTGEVIEKKDLDEFR